MTAFDVDPVDVAGWETGIKAAQQHFLDLMEGKPVVLAVGYEELSSDRDTEVLPVGISRGLLEFLGIEDVARLLRTVLRKTS